ncbi:MAG: UTP--glucose-1-phosphate uridylyltransferase [Pseudoruegeria sp.]
MTRIKTAIFPVAGLGTRFLPTTKSVPKELLPVYDRPLIEYAVEEARLAGIERFVFVNSRNKSSLENHFRAAPALEANLAQKEKVTALQKVRRSILGEALEVVYQDAPLGLGHAVFCAREFVGNRPFAVILPDDFLMCEQPCLAQMIDAWSSVGGNMLATVDVGIPAISAYGCLSITGSDGRLISADALVEKPQPDQAPSTKAVIGRYILQPSVMKRLGQTKPGTGGEIQLTDAISADIKTSGLYGYEFEGQRFDCGQPAGLVEASVAVSRTRVNQVAVAA